MTGNVLLDLAISLGGIAILLLISVALGAMHSVVVTEETATNRARFDEPDFVPGDWLIDAGGKAALSIDDANGDLLCVFSLGDRLATRRYGRGPREALAQKAKIDGQTLILPLGDLAKPRLRLDAGAADAATGWLGRLRAKS